MHDLKNILLAWVSSAPAFLSLAEGSELITIISAVVLPTIFFLLGKAVDVAVQIWLRRRSGGRSSGRGKSLADS